MKIVTHSLTKIYSQCHTERDKFAGALECHVKSESDWQNATKVKKSYRSRGRSARSARPHIIQRSRRRVMQSGERERGREREKGMGGT